MPRISPRLIRVMMICSLSLENASKTHLVVCRLPSVDSWGSSRIGDDSSRFIDLEVAGWASCIVKWSIELHREIPAG